MNVVLWVKCGIQLIIKCRLLTSNLFDMLLIFPVLFSVDGSILCFTPLNDGIRVISFRKANNREASRNDKSTTVN